MQRLFNATIHSLRGLRHSISHETAVRQEAVVLAVAVVLGLFVAPSPAWYVAMIGVILIVLAVELLNTAIEGLSDHVTPVGRRPVAAVCPFSLSREGRCAKH